MGSPLTVRLLDDGDTVIDFPAKLSARVRMLDRGHSRKTDEADAVSTAAAALANDSLHTVRIDPAAQALRLLSDRRDDLIAARTLVINRLHAAPTHLVPGGAPTSLNAAAASRLLASVRTRDQVKRARREIAKDLLADLRRLDGQITTLDKNIIQAVRATGSTLTALFGLGPVLAARILGRVGDINRFPSEALRLLLRRRANRGILRRRRAAPPLPGRRPDLEPCPAHDGDHPSQVPSRRAGLLPAQTCRGEEPQRGNTMPETPPRQRDLPNAESRRRPRGGGPGRTSRGVSNIQRGQLNPDSSSSEKSQPEPTERHPTRPTTPGA